VEEHDVACCSSPLRPGVRADAEPAPTALTVLDFTAFAYTHSAINEGYRAIQDLSG
jgi:hypothetical protein